MDMSTGLNVEGELPLGGDYVDYFLEFVGTKKNARTRQAFSPTPIGCHRLALVGEVFGSNLMQGFV